MQELNIVEIEEVSGAGFFKQVGEAIGFLFGRGTATQQSVNDMDNYMLSAMQYGA